MPHFWGEKYKSSKIIFECFVDEFVNTVFHVFVYLIPDVLLTAKISCKETEHAVKARTL
jgi:hypothetical protein